MLRDPVSRFRSHFLNRSAAYARVDFDRWVLENWVHNWQTKMIAGEPNAEKATELLITRFGFIGLTERFDESIAMLGRWLQEPGFRAEYRRVNQYSQKGSPQEAAKKREGTQYLHTDAVRFRMLEVNREDQKVYDHVASVVFPQQVAAYNGCLAADVLELRRRLQTAGPLTESLWSRTVRNYVYKPLTHLRVA
jgi:hypothetical protein